MKKNSINVVNNHAKFVCDKIRTANRLPFTEILPVEWIDKRIKEIEYRD